jgi:hypothetical protein
MKYVFKYLLAVIVFLVCHISIIVWHLRVGQFTFTDVLDGIDEMFTTGSDYEGY